MDTVIKVLLIIILVAAAIVVLPILLAGLLWLVGVLKGVGNLILWIIIIALIIYIIWGN
jgi:hypothetical protein